MVSQNRGVNLRNTDLKYPGVNMAQSVLVTGLSGLIGTRLREEIGDQCELSALNRSLVAGIPTTQAQLTDEAALARAMTNMDTVIHLAAKIHDGVGWPDLHETNVVGTRNVFEAAARAGVRRVVFASSGATVAGWEKEEPYKALVTGDYDKVPDDMLLINEDMPTRPANLYASTKVWGEALARHYADNHNLEIVCLRIGFANKEDMPLNARQFSVWNSQRDVTQAFRLAINCELPSRMETFFILSNNHHAYRDITRAKEVLGFIPQDAAENFSRGL